MTFCFQAKMDTCLYKAIFTIITPSLSQLRNTRHKTKVEPVLCCIYCVADAMGGVDIYCYPSLSCKYFNDLNMVGKWKIIQTIMESYADI